tara:strand:- start:1498 stop:2220 length:723 start_codon:yes stop_codon:yes gene_type:complete
MLYDLKMQNPDNNLNNSNIKAQTVDLTKIYTTGQIELIALDKFSTEFKTGELVSVVGQSGSGKSTLLNLLGTLDKPTSGKIIIDGIDTTKMNHNELAVLRNEKIGFIFQSFNLISRTTVMKNIEMPAISKGSDSNVRNKKVIELLDLMGISETAKRKPTELSGGQQQRVAIARALINDPAIILADEPTGNLDSKTGEEIFQLLKRLCKERNTTIILVTHNLELAKRTDRIIKLSDGKLVN